ncbi:MAG TPA: amidase, partial [Rhodanobacter sp.]|nr:amidase [Rhodanobacter sp.]
MKTRRQFLANAPLGLLGLAVAAGIEAKDGEDVQPPPGTPGAFNTAPAVGPEVTPATFAEAEKLAQVTLTDAQRAMAATSWRTSMAGMLERRSGPRTLALEASLAPATV